MGWSRGKEEENTDLGLRPLGCINTQLHRQGRARMGGGFKEAACRICGQEAHTGGQAGQAGMLSPETLLSFQESICSGSGCGVSMSICTPNTH